MFLIYSLPSLIYVLVHRRDWRAACSRVGWRWGTPVGYGLATALLVFNLLASWAVLKALPADVWEMPGVVVLQTLSASAVIGVVLRAAGEEIFFRGFLGNLLIRKLGFTWGNLAQAIVFLLPHLMLLSVDLRLWPLLPLQFAIGWLLGWLTHRSGSVLPAIVVHAVTNVAVGLLFVS